MNFVTLWIVSVLADDSGHHGLAQLGYVVLIVVAILYLLGFLAAAVSSN